MLVRDIKTLPMLGNEIIYIDEKTGNKVSGIVMYKEIVNEHLAFVYVASPYKDENTHKDYGFDYKDIIVFDDRGNDNNGWYRDTVLANYGKYIRK